MSKHTAGDWGADGTMVVTPPPDETLRRIQAREFPFECKLIAICDPSHYVPQNEAEANARLIAGATRMLAVLEFAREAIGPQYAYHDPVLARLLTEIEDAIAAATGTEAPR